MWKRSASVGTVLALCAVVACQGGAAASALTEADRAALQKTFVDGHGAALAARDFEAYAHTFTPDGVLLPPNGAGIKGQAAMAQFLSGFPPYSDFKLGVTTIDGSGDIAYVQGTYSMMITPPGATAAIADTGKWVVTAKKQSDGAWKGTIVIWNSDVPLPAPPAPAK